MVVKIWISKNSEVPVRDQLIAQITLAIAAGDFETGEKLPSTREIARRCDLHSNTVSAVYQRLVDQQLLEFRKRSGLYVTEFANETIEGTRKLEKMIAEMLVAILRTDGGSVLLTGSRRTGAPGLAVLRRRLKGLSAAIWDG